MLCGRDEVVNPQNLRRNAAAQTSAKNYKVTGHSVYVSISYGDCLSFAGSEAWFLLFTIGRCSRRKGARWFLDMKEFLSIYPECFFFANPAGNFRGFHQTLTAFRPDCMGRLLKEACH